MNPVRVVFRSKPCPRDGVVAHLVHFPEREDLSADGQGMTVPEYWTVRLYRDNYDSFSAEDRLVIFNWVSDIIKEMRMFEPRSYVEVHERYPNE